MEETEASGFTAECYSEYSDDEALSPELLSMHELEACLGFHSRNGLSKTKGVRDIPVMADLLDGINEIASRFLQYKRNRIHESNTVKQAAGDLFYRLGSRLWPPDCEPCSLWLFDSTRDGQTTASRLVKYLPSRLHFDFNDERQQ